MAAVERHAAIPKPLSLFASRLSHHRSGDEELRVLEAALSVGADVPALLATRSAARRLLRARAAEALVAAGPVEDDGRRIAIANFFARAFALVGDVEVSTAPVPRSADS
ncbi:protein DOUBLE-STRAND BREAK FORMATION-like [Phragmites australis]|uniref:protein DOUBLE-STRAND BREAK FORMATION-like n=1 Tax=Phragmites australis TaxID=29695 RepID=UPI002D793173|nr:protein DOUBLE-STRAND BREAK FORMATION-like [Phragmites australis]